MVGGFDVVVSAGSLRSDDERAVDFRHRWTPEGVAVEADFTGARLLRPAAEATGIQVQSFRHRDANAFAALRGPPALSVDGFMCTGSYLLHHVGVERLLRRCPRPVTSTAGTGKACTASAASSWYLSMGGVPPSGLAGQPSWLRRSRPGSARHPGAGRPAPP